MLLTSPTPKPALMLKALVARPDVGVLGRVLIQLKLAGWTRPRYGQNGFKSEETMCQKIQSQ
jgi:hypothetical protein